MTIPEPKFYLKNLNSVDSTLIYLQAKYSCNGQQRVMLSTGDRILPNEWDLKKQRAIVNKKSPGNSDLNLWLDKMATSFKTIFRNCLIDGITPTASLIKDKMEDELNLKIAPVKQEVTLFSFIETFINNCRSIKSPNTIKSYNSTFVRMKDYGQTLNRNFNFEDITLEWRSGFIHYLQSLGVCRNTEGKHLKNIKVFLNEATERNLNHNLSFKSKSFSKPHEETNKIFLSTEEIKRVAGVDLSGDIQREIVRDYFVISCLTSLRYSDVIRIKEEHIKGDKVRIVTLKTGKEVIIPISPLLRSILEKYNYRLPKAPCNQVFNRHLKDIGKLAEINDTVSITSTIGGIKQTKEYKKWQLLTSHTGRRSLVSNCILEGINHSSIMLISGHKSLKVFQGYVRVSEQQNAEMLSKHAFFKQN